MSPEYRRKNGVDQCTGDQCTDATNFDPARPLREILMDYRQILESVYQPAAYASRIDRLMSMLDRSRHINNRLSMTSFSRTSARECTIGSLRPLLKRNASSWLTFLNCAKRLVTGTHRDRLDRGLCAGSSNRSTAVWPLWTVDIAPHFLG
ncbi:DUF4070 domain-containing protein [Bradyrhizobium centrolobii]|uniref:DUF4070 domain-containing protein n=1 Tax=Bradyrhizobium centrolobii TaxID=1505087 RepID=UPI000A4657E7|nr:DUF4070 domain-containing protein [Bradyrhizobium centrolobii]